MNRLVQDITAYPGKMNGRLVEAVGIAKVAEVLSKQK